MNNYCIFPAFYTKIQVTTATIFVDIKNKGVETLMAKDQKEIKSTVAIDFLINFEDVPEIKKVSEKEKDSLPAWAFFERGIVVKVSFECYPDNDETTQVYVQIAEEESGTFDIAVGYDWPNFSLFRQDCPAIFDKLVKIAEELQKNIQKRPRMFRKFQKKSLM